MGITGINAFTRPLHDTPWPTSFKFNGIDKYGMSDPEQWLEVYAMANYLLVWLNPVARNWLSTLSTLGRNSTTTLLQISRDVQNLFQVI